MGWLFSGRNGAWRALEGRSGGLVGKLTQNWRSRWALSRAGAFGGFGVVGKHLSRSLRTYSRALFE